MVMAVCLSLPALASAQGGETQIGFKAGINISSIKIDDQGTSITGDGRTGFLGGLWIARDFNPRVGIQVEGLYSVKGSEFNAFEVFDDDTSISLSYIEIPALARINFPVAPVVVRVLAGPTFAFNVNESLKLNNVEADADQLPLKPFEMGLSIGGAVEFNSKYIVDARYTWGLINILDNEEAGAPDDVSVKNKTFSISFGYRFK
jgi:hypothetical protein